MNTYHVQLFVGTTWRDYGKPYEEQGEAITKFRQMEKKDPDGIWRVVRMTVIRPVFDKQAA